MTGPPKLTAIDGNRAGRIEAAQNLYVREGLTLAAVAEASGIPLRTISDWSSRYQWVALRRRYLAEEEEIGDLRRRLELKLARAALSEEIDPQAIYAMAKAAAVLKPAAGVALREIEKAEAEARSASVEERMQKVREFLSGAGFGT